MSRRADVNNRFSEYFACKSLIFNLQLQQFRLQLVVFVTRRLAMCLFPISQGVFVCLGSKRSHKVHQLRAAATEHEYVILLLLLGVRQRKFGQLVQEGGQGHTKRGRLVVSQA